RDGESRTELAAGDPAYTPVADESVADERVELGEGDGLRIDRQVLGHHTQRSAPVGLERRARGEPDFAVDHRNSLRRAGGGDPDRCRRVCDAEPIDGADTVGYPQR